MEETYLLKHPGVKKKILNGGQGPMPHFPKGTKLVFHFQTLLDNFERTVIDDSRKNKHPTEIFVGKMFKMEVWEVLLTSMRIGEVAEFWCDAIGKDPLDGQKHMCGLGNMFHYHSTGYPELDELMRTPQPLIFIMELISVGDPLCYHRESWLMEKDEKLKAVPSLHHMGNTLVRQGKFREAAEKYQEAVLLLRTVQSREMPGDEDYINLGRLIIPLVLNYCQCMLELEEYYEVIEHTTELLDKHKDCVKAYYKRAKAYAAVWSEREARRDFQMVANLDITLARLVHRELSVLSERMKEKYLEDKKTYWNILEDEPEKQDTSEINRKEETVNEDAEKENEHCTRSEEPASEDNQKIIDLTEGKDWQQMLRLIMLLQDEGNFNVKEQNYSEAVAKFKQALEFVDHLQTKASVEHKGEDWESLEKVRLPLCLNLSQCKLELGEYQDVVDLNSKLLKKHKDNLKAVYQRGRAHSMLCNEDEARRDFARVIQLDPTFTPIVKQEIKKLCDSIRVKSVKENKNYWSNTQDNSERKSQGKEWKEMKKGVTWADESKTPGRNDEGGSGCSGEELNKNDGQHMEENCEDKKDESSLTLQVEEKKSNNTEKKTLQSNVIGESTTRLDIDTEGKGTLQTNDMRQRKDDKQESHTEASGGVTRLMDTVAGTEHTTKAPEFKKEKTAAKPGKSNKKVKRKQKKK
ncbi:hypothetical protein DNTS_006431 [Danionella cerebrum]|uniref:AIP/AIPL N-terminal FKBP-type PPIase domain-containing protein n=1 Tax=Danionella cerebrum TaxID=2873325 RepID=A0A553N3V2_9TELE|nr:hypothetical protein DNTS_006431 [Danionella translucida]